MKPLAEVSLLAPDAAPASVFTRERLAAVPSLAPAATAGVDWQLVVALRRKASDVITRRLAEAVQDGSPPLSALDRRLLGRSVVRSVVAEHAARLGADGRALWPVESERAYAVAVEKAARCVFQTGTGCFHWCGPAACCALRRSHSAC